MALMDLCAFELAERIRKGEVTPLHAVRDCFARIDERNPQLTAFTYLMREEAFREAAELTKALQEGKDIGPLGGVPLAVKDLEDVRGAPTGYGTTIFAKGGPMSAPAKHDSLEVERLRAAGAIVVGKTTTPAFGHIAVTRSRAHPPTSNPLNTALSCGGSSGGSAAAVAGGMVPFATGSDGGGSIRIPAALCGIYGIKPTRGVVPDSDRMFRVTPWIPLGHLGPLTKSVRDAALYLDAVAGYHPEDLRSVPLPPKTFTKDLDTPLASLRIAYVEGHPEMLPGVAALQRLGHRVTPVTLHLPDFAPAWGLSGSQTYAVAQRKIPKEYHAELDRSLTRGWVSAAKTGPIELSKLSEMVYEANETMAQLFKHYDVLITPALPGVTMPWKLKGPVEPLDSLRYLMPFNHTGHPACVLRLPGLSPKGYPIYMQAVADRFQDPLLLRLSLQFEQREQTMNVPAPFPFHPTQLSD
eukprot:Sspe_Gene.59807::Locus_32884_Transcript_1_1_Confidence_1.000_Length_1464::g.59807::m.59807/K02433/gatA, QRSL1; aspartyl-tRNA(Asn)/glutamyl-tRNA(Gln) amidotransferase subunit A